MHRSFVAEFAARRPAIRHAWEKKLRLEPVTSPLANPDTLVLMMDRTLDDLRVTLAARCNAPIPLPARAVRTGCLCGLNPLLAYYRVAASVIPTVMSQGADRCPTLNAAAYAACLQETLAAVQAIAQEEIRSFCAMCQTEIVRGTRHAPASTALPFVLADR